MGTRPKHFQTVTLRDINLKHYNEINSPEFTDSWIPVKDTTKDNTRDKAMSHVTGELSRRKSSLFQRLSLSENLLKFRLLLEWLCFLRIFLIK